MNVALILAGGSGSRTEQSVPKQFISIYEKPIIIYTLEVFQKHPNVDGIIVSCIDGWHEVLKSYAAASGITKLKWVVSGGDNGQSSARNVGIDRNDIMRVQTPQAYRYGKVLWAHKEALDRGITDAVYTNTLMLELGEELHFSYGSNKNIKITTLEDIDIFKALYASKRDKWLKKKRLKLEEGK